MARVFLFSPAKSGEMFENCALVVRSAEQDPFKIHSVTTDAHAADLILCFSGDPLALSDVRGNPLIQKNRGKSFAVNESDHVIPFLPGIYTSIEQRYYRRSRYRGGPYLRVLRQKSTSVNVKMGQASYLFSFVGACCNSEVRLRLRDLKHPRGFILDTTNDPGRGYGQTSQVYKKFVRQYVDSLEQSRFILCPRGVSVSSYRLFEAMRAGRVPVVLSDPWVPPEGPAWDEFSLRVKEGEVRSLPDLLEERESEAEKMGRRAKIEWDQWFSEEVIFHRLVEWCLDIQRTRRVSEKYLRWTAYLQVLRPFYLHHYVLKRWRMHVFPNESSQA